MDIFLGGSACGIVAVDDEVVGWGKAYLGQDKQGSGRFKEKHLSIGLN